MVINKSAVSLESQIELGGVPELLEGQIYRYSDANLGEIEAVGAVQVGSTFTESFPAQSITMLVLQEAP